MSSRYSDFASFYPFYLSEHRNVVCRRLHFAGSLGALFCLGMSLAGEGWGWLLAGLVCGYACAWVGHYFFEHNRPATFSYPLYSFIGDWAMFRDICLGRIRW